MVLKQKCRFTGVWRIPNSSLWVSPAKKPIYIFYNKKLPMGQSWLLQACVSEFSFPQSLPSFAGGGFVQVLVRV